MNVFFHTTTAIGIAIALTDTQHFHSNTPIKNTFPIAFCAFVVGIIGHGALDYIPHCYPIPSKADVVFGLFIILICLWRSHNTYRFILFASFVGSIFPDLIDLSPSILHKYIGTPIPTTAKLFPWHWHEYSGSIYTQNCDVSTFNHILVLITVTIICWFRRRDLKVIFNKK
ncbi:MAG: hypothetical protein ACPGVB_10325 [Chitinophagales bacterium]